MELRKGRLYKQITSSFIMSLWFNTENTLTGTIFTNQRFQITNQSRKTLLIYKTYQSNKNTSKEKILSNKHEMSDDMFVHTCAMYKEE